MFCSDLFCNPCTASLHNSPAQQLQVPIPTHKTLTNNWEGLVAAARDRPRDMFTACGGTKETDKFIVTLEDRRHHMRNAWVPPLPG